ncbi:uncharacterized protein [Malus domestica]|uniref:uncharacterized protein n=1 Tax=Malus domestica TaxID=3750 RepID=UPI0039756133
MSLSKRLYEQQKKVLAQQEELFNLEEGGDEAFAMEEDEDDEHRRFQASHSRRVMEAMGAQNSLNVFAQSLVFDELLQGKASRCTYWVNGHKYDGAYYLADGIYPRWTTFVKTVPHPQSEKEKHFAKCQKGCRKDVKRCFGILQARWAIVRATARMFDVKALRSIMMTCIILHNMIVEDEYDYDVVDEYELDTMNNSRTRIYFAHDWTENPVQHKSLERDGSYNQLIIKRYTSVQESYWHISCQRDLIENQWGLQQGEDN